MKRVDDVTPTPEAGATVAPEGAAIRAAAERSPDGSRWQARRKALTRPLVGAALAGALMMGGSIAAHATVTVDATASIYDAGQTTTGYGANGSLPPAITLSAGVTAIQFTSVTGSLSCGSPEGCITLNGGGNLNDPDGAGAASASTNTGTASISGLSASNAGFLVGLFVAGTVPTGSAPAALDFTSGGLGTSFSSLSPLLDQTFIVGDGLTGDGTGSLQSFNVPTGATTLYLGISDAGGYNGPPGGYLDNSGTYSVAVAQQGTTAIPEPAGWAVFFVPLVALAALRRRLPG